MIHTSLDDAFASMLQFMSISTRKCKVCVRGGRGEEGRGGREEGASEGGQQGRRKETHTCSHQEIKMSSSVEDICNTVEPKKI